jgi:preprotein translocase subunit SecF
MSIEFTGGTLMEVRLPETKTKADMEKSLAAFKTKDSKALENVNVAAVHGAAGNSMIVRMGPLDNEDHQALLAGLKKEYGSVDELRFNTIGPSVSASLRRNSLYAIAVASVALILYLAFSFRKLPRRLSPWKFGVLAVIAFIHDVVITAGIFTVVSHFTTFEVDTLFVTALLTILAYSANDTIVIFDRIRSSMQMEMREELEATVVRGLKECFTRTLNTTMASLIMLFSLLVLGSESIRWFMLTLIVGTIVGTYSSYFVAAPLLIFWRKKSDRR